MIIKLLSGRPPLFMVLIQKECVLSMMSIQDSSLADIDPRPADLEAGMLTPRPKVADFGGHG